MNRISNIIYFDDYHLTYEPSNLFKSKKYKLDDKRIEYEYEDDNMNPKYLLLVFDFSNIKMRPYNDKNNCELKFNNGYISKDDKYLIIENNKLLLSKRKQKWSYNGTLYNHKYKVYIYLTYKYEIILTKKIQYASLFLIERNNILYLKSNIQVKFEMNNIDQHILNKIENVIYYQNNNKHNICLLLAGGHGTRFSKNEIKQLYKINDKPIIQITLETFEKTDMIYKYVIVTNSDCYKNIKKIINKIKLNTKCEIVVNDINCRLKSIECGLEQINKINNVKNIIIHDSVRCFIRKKDIEKIINYGNIYKYVQYIIKLVNGFHKLYGNELINRDDYIELVTPLCMESELCKFIFLSYIKNENRIVYEFINILKLINIEYKFIECNIKFFKKITTFDDL